VAFTLDVGHIVLAIVAALIGVVWRTLQSEIHRIDAKVDKIEASFSNMLSAEVQRIAAHQAERMNANNTRTTNLESALSGLHKQIESLASDMRDQLKRVELQIASSHPTKLDLENIWDTKNKRLAMVEDELRTLNRSLMHVVNVPPQAQPRRRSQG